MPYSTTTLSAAIQAVSNRLTDPAFVHWTAAEIQGYLFEALRTWGALTSSFRDEAVFGTVASQAFYDVAVVAPTLCGLSVTDRDLVTQIQYGLLEPPGVPWTGSLQFALSDVVDAIQRRRDQFLRETGIILQRQTTTIAPPPDGRIPIPQSIVGIRRAAWISVSGAVQPLVLGDEWAFNHYSQAWVQTPDDPPITYSVGVTPPLVVQVAPIPLVSGTLDLCAVVRGPTLDPTIPTVLGVPDDWTWVVKFGALADLLGRNGVAVDAQRAEYCEARWRQGVTLATVSPRILAARINNVTCLIASLHGADSYDVTWQGRTPAQPQTLLLANQNLFALSPTPNNPIGGQYGVTLDVVRNAPIPATLGSYLQVGPELLDTLFDYAQHLALFKEGGAQLQASQELLDRFLRAAGVSTDFTEATVPNEKPQTEQSVQDQRQVPRVWPSTPTQVVGVGGVS